MLPETYTVFPLIVACADHAKSSAHTSPGQLNAADALTEHGQGRDRLLRKNGLLRDGHGRYQLWRFGGTTEQRRSIGEDDARADLILR